MPRRLPAAAPRLYLERLQGFHVHGWVWDPATPGREALAWSCGGVPIPASVQRSEREDVDQALGVQVPGGAGFRLEVPAEVWSRLDGHGLRITVNGQPIDHAPIWPDLADIERWGLWAARHAPPPEAERLRALVEAHRAARAAHPVAAAPPKGAFVPADPPAQTVVEALHGLRIVGWSTAPIDSATVDLSVGDGRLGVPFVRVERQDVAAVLGLQDAHVGFEVELPGALWALAGSTGSALNLRLWVEGQAVGPVLALAREAPLQAVDQAMAIGDPGARRLAALLALEHLQAQDAVSTLSLTQRAGLREMTAGLCPPGWLGAAGGREQSAPLPAWAPLPRAGRVAGLLRSRTVCALVHAGLRRLSPVWSRRVEVALTRRLGLFDRRFYQAQAAADGSLAQPALRHYIEVGQSRGLSPMLLFDPGHYVRQLPGRQPPPINPLLHHVLWGRFRGLTPSAWFDEAAYLAGNADVRRRRLDPLAHFHNHGFREGRVPRPGFDADRATRDGVVQRLARQQALAPDQPLLRYLQRGLPPDAPTLRHGRPPWFGAWKLDGRDFLEPSVWDGLPRQPAATLAATPGLAVVDIVVPVYAGHQESLRSLWAVLARPQVTPHELVVVDDCGPEPVLREMLAWLAGRGHFTLLVNDSNLGFVKSVNRGLALHPDRDVVILNADTRVHGDWLDRLMAHARAAPLAASITPLSNNATVCSYPRTLDGNDELDEQAGTALDAAAARLNAGVHVEVPTGVGFCMFMRRETLRGIGLLDAERFGRGYGEENDWCLRATQAGWQHLIAADIYVTHSGSVSFGAEASPRVREALRLIRETFPDYPQRIEAYIAADPLHAARARLDAARLQAAAPGDWVLTVNHDRGGGTARHEREEGARLRERGLNLLALRPDRQGRVQLIAPDVVACPNLQGLPMAVDGLLAQVLGALPLREIHVHHLADFPAQTAECLRAWAVERGLKLIVTLHDYHMMCPRITFIAPDGRYCGEPDAPGCLRCLSTDGLIERSGPIEPWRARFEPLLRAAAEVRVPDADLAPRIARHWPGVSVVVRPHEPGLVIAPPHTLDHGVRHVLVIGALSAMKGLDVLKALAASGVARSAGLRFTLLGYSADDDGLRRAGVQVLGAYDDEQLPARIDALAPDLIFIPSIWPETYSYVLSAALRARRRVAVFDLGAQARRARAADVQAMVIPLALAERPDDLARMLSWSRTVA